MIGSSWAWGVAQFPRLLPGSGLTLTDASAPESVLVTIVVIFVAAALLVGPSFLLLFRLQARQLLEAEKHAEETDTPDSRTPGSTSH